MPAADPPTHLTDAEVYRSLREIAGHSARSERVGHTLPPTAIVHEVWLRLAKQPEVSFPTHAAFRAWAAAAVRHVLVDHARARNAAKRGGGARREPLRDHPAPEGVDMGALHEALEQLAGHHARSARVVEMRFFGGMSNEDIAIELRVTSRTVQNDWTLARGWLLQQLSDPEGRAP